MMSVQKKKKSLNKYLGVGSDVAGFGGSNTSVFCGWSGHDLCSVTLSVSWVQCSCYLRSHWHS